MANEALEEVAVVLIFFVRSSASPPGVLEGIVIAIAHLPQEVDEALCRSLIAIRLSFMYAVFDYGDKVLQTGSKVFHRRISTRKCPFWRAAIPRVPIKGRERASDVLPDLLKESDCTGLYWLCFTQALVDSAVVDGKAEDGTFKVELL